MPADGAPVSRLRAAAYTLAGQTTNVGIVAVQSLVLTPLFLRHVGQRLYGAWLGSGDVLLWLQAFDLGVPNILIQRIGAAHGRGDDAEVGRWLANGAVVLLIAGAIVAAAGAALAGMLPGWFGIAGAEGAQLARAFLVGSLATGGLLPSHLGLAYARGVQRTGTINAVTAVAALGGFGATLALLLGGWGLMAIAWGLAARTAMLLGGAALVLAREVPAAVWRAARLHRGTMAELARVTPATTIGGLAFAAMTQSELAIIGTTLGPATAAMFMVTRRASELARALADTISWSTYGSFAHLVGSPDRARAGDTYRQLFSIRDSVAVALAAAYVAANPSFVGAWVGDALFGGATLTILIGAQSVVTGGAFLANYLYRATGAVGEGSVLLAAEAAVRVGVAVALLRSGAGVAAIPVAAIGTSLAFGWWARRCTARALPDVAIPARTSTLPMWLARALLFTAAAAVCREVQGASWPLAIALAVLFGGGGLGVLLMLDPHAVRIRAAVAAIGAAGRTRST